MDSYSQIVFSAFLQETLKGGAQAGKALCSVYLHVYCCFLRAWWHGEEVVSKTRYFFVLRLVTVDPGVNTAEEGTGWGRGSSSNGLLPIPSGRLWKLSSGRTEKLAIAAHWV